MVKFKLENAHPGYRDKIEGIMKGLLSRYPFVKLRLVTLYEPDSGDKSMGNSDIPGEIALNSFWFSKPPEFLQNAALEDVMVDIGGKELAWHGTLFVEPDHVLTHEFAHVLTENFPQWEKWTEPRWKEATADPQSAPSGYALASTDEYFAELFALVELGLATESQTEDLYQLLSGK